MQLKTILRQVPDPRGKQGQDYMLWSILSLIIVSLRWTARNEGGLSCSGGASAGVKRWTRLHTRTTPCHATLTETSRVIDAEALADVLVALRPRKAGTRVTSPSMADDAGRKDSEGKAEHVLSAFCSSLQTVLGHEASRSKGLEIPIAELLERLDSRGKIVTGDAIFCQKSIAAEIVERGGDYVFPVKDNQNTLRQDIETAFNEPVFPPCSWNSGVEKAHGRIDGARSRLPAEAAGIPGEWPTVRQICRVIRSRQVKKNAEWQKPQHEVVYLVSSLPAAAVPQALPGVNRDHWRIEIMIETRTILGEDGYELLRERSSKHFLLTNFVLKILKSVAPSPTRAIEHFQDHRNRVIPADVADFD